MAAGQLWLFPPPRPLVERLGADFFRALPERPGVYLMCGAEEGVLYVGSANNLRRRISSYRVANPERLPRHMVRLLHRVTRIEIDECTSDAAARAREEMLICVLAPRFNRAGKVWPVPDTQRFQLAHLRSGALGRAHVESGATGASMSDRPQPDWRANSGDGPDIRALTATRVLSMISA